MYAILQPGERLGGAFFSRLDLVQTIDYYARTFKIHDGIAVFVGASSELPNQLHFITFIPKNKISLFLSLGEAANEGGSAAVQK